VGREQDREVAGGDRAHEGLLELLPRHRIQARQWLVQHQQVGSFGQRQSQRDLCLLPTGQGAGPATHRDAQVGQAPHREVMIEAHVARPAEAQQIGDREVAVERVVLGEETDPGQHLHAVGGRGLAEHLDRPRGRDEQSDRQPQQSGLAGAVRADQSGYRTRRQLQSAVAQGPGLAVDLAQIRGTQRRFARHAAPAFFDW
jgi:hypothetical protein